MAHPGFEGFEGATQANNMTQGQARSVFFTLNNYEEHLVPLLFETLKAWDAVTYVVFGKEVAPTTGTPHLQGYMELSTPKHFSTIRNKLKTVYMPESLSSPWVTRHNPRWTNVTASEYCKKGGDFMEHGQLNAQGERTDLKVLAEDIRQGKRTVWDIMDEDPMTYHQYGRTLEKIQAKRNRGKVRSEMTQGIWIYGPSGCGKSHRAFEGYSESTHYIKNLEEEWWDGYEGQETVIMNEFRGQIKFNHLLALTDKWPMTVKVRHQAPVQFLAKKIIITSVLRPKEVYHNLDGNDTWAQFDRRFEVIDQEQENNENDSN